MSRKHRKQRAAVEQRAAPQALTSGFGFWNTFEGSRFDTDRSFIPWIATDSKDSLNTFSRNTMTQAARYCDANIGLAGALVDTIVDWAGAPIPIALSSDSVFNDEVEAAYLENSRAININPQYDYALTCRQALRSPIVDGDLGAIIRRVGKQPKIQFIESHRITDGGNGENVCDGVKYIKTENRVVSYFVHTGDDSYQEIPAQDFLLLGLPLRPDELRHVTAFHRSINRFRDLFTDILRNEILSSKMASAVGLQLEGGDAGRRMFGAQEKRTGGSGGGSSALSPNEVTFEKMRGGALVRTPAGQKFSVVESSRPGAAQMGLYDFICADICIGWGIPVQFLLQIAGQGTAERRVLLQVQKVVDKWQQHVLIGQLLDKWFYLTTAAAFAKSANKPKDWLRHDWQTPAKMTVDKGRESQQRRQNILLGIESESDWTSDSGRNQSQVRETILRERKNLINQAIDLRDYAKAKGFEIGDEKSLELLRQGSPNATAQQTEPEEPEPVPQPPAKKGGGK